MGLNHLSRRGLYFALLVGLLVFFTGCKMKKEVLYETELHIVKERAKSQLQTDAIEFNNYDDRPKSDGPFNAANNTNFLINNIPFFISSDIDFTRVYNYRWWMISKHLKQYNDPRDEKQYWVVTEFFGDRPWASLSGAITCPVGHQFYDVRWLRDPKYLKSYADYFMSGSASYLPQRENENFLTYKSRPESHHFSSWMIDGVEAFLKIHPDKKWQREILPFLEKHQQVWDSLFTVMNPHAETSGLYKILDLYDGMEFSLSAVLGLIESEGAYSLYTEENWRTYYLGWETTDMAARSSFARQYPKAFRKGYPDLYLSRPSINSYAYGNLSALANLYELQDDATSVQKSKLYQRRASTLQKKILQKLWNQDDQFFHTSTAGDNQFGIRDFQARVRESVGYTPWYFNLIPKADQSKYEKAWDMFASKQGFANESGMTTAERQHPFYNEQAYAWNGRGWPFENSVVYKSYANYLRNYKTSIEDSDRELLYSNIDQLVQLHGKNELNIGEWYIPSDGKSFGGDQLIFVIVQSVHLFYLIEVPIYKDYFHSTFPDIIIEDLIGFKALHEDKFVLEPLLPAKKWDYFYLGNINYHGHLVDIIWKRDWDSRVEGEQSNICIFVDGKLVAKNHDLNAKITVEIRPNTN